MSHTGALVGSDETFSAALSRSGVLRVETIGQLFAAAKALFCADTLFSLGCGRLFEGTPAQMWHSLSKFAPLPDDAIVTINDTHWLRVPVGKLHTDRYVPLHPELVELITDWQTANAAHTAQGGGLAGNTG